jgi:hypothetical protein
LAWCPRNSSLKKVLGTIMLNLHPFADEIKRHPEVEVLLVTRDNKKRAPTDRVNNMDNCDTSGTRVSCW